MIWTVHDEFHLLSRHILKFYLRFWKHVVKVYKIRDQQLWSLSCELHSEVPRLFPRGAEDPNSIKMIQNSGQCSHRRTVNFQSMILLEFPLVRTLSWVQQYQRTGPRDLYVSNFMSIRFLLPLHLGTSFWHFSLLILALIFFCNLIQHSSVLGWVQTCRLDPVTTKGSPRF